MKTSKKILITVVILVGFFAVMYVGNMLEEKDPAYLPQASLYYGRPAFMRLHRPGPDPGGVQWVTFYHASNADPNDDPVKDGKRWIISWEICMVPTEMALTMHHKPTSGYLK